MAGATQQADARLARRLKQVAEHLLPDCTPAAAAVDRKMWTAHVMQVGSPVTVPNAPFDDLLADSRATGLYRKPRLLSNQQMATFLGTGFLSLPVDDVAPEVHKRLHATAERKWVQSGEDNGAGLGNNIWPSVPELGDVLRSAVVHGGLQSILGGSYTMSAHRHMHNSSTQGEQPFHKDTDNRGAYTHRPRTVIMFFVPAGATLEMGPTAIIPCSHLMSTDNADWSCLKNPAELASLFPEAEEFKLTAPAHTGVAVLLHQALLHRGTARLLPVAAELPWRCMFKFIFTRTRAPTIASWDTTTPPADWGLAGMAPGTAGACASLWHWLGGDHASGPHENFKHRASVEVLGARLTAPHVPGDESVRQQAGYGLANLVASRDSNAGAAVQSLLDALTHPQHEGPRRVAVSALTAAGDGAVPGLLGLLQRTRVSIAHAEQGDEHLLRTLTYAADALGEAATSKQYWLPALNVLGNIMRGIDEVTSSLGHPLRSGNGKAAYHPSRSILAAVEHIAQRAVVAADHASCQAASKILLSALDGPSATGAAAAVVSLAIADRHIIGPEQHVALVNRLSDRARTEHAYRERAMASEALKRLVATRAATPIARATLRVIQSCVETEWFPPNQDPRQNGEIAGRHQSL